MADSSTAKPKKPAAAKKAAAAEPTGAPAAKQRFAKALDEAKAGAEALTKEAQDRAKAYREKATSQSSEWIDEAKELLIRSRTTHLYSLGERLREPRQRAIHVGFGLLLNAAEAEQGITSLIELILEFRVRAIVVMSGSPPSSIVDECMANGVRVILVNRQLDDTEADTIVSDDLGGARIAAERSAERRNSSNERRRSIRSRRRWAAPHAWPCA